MREMSNASVEALSEILGKVFDSILNNQEEVISLEGIRLIRNIVDANFVAIIGNLEDDEYIEELEELKALKKPRKRR